MKPMRISVIFLAATVCGCQSKEQTSRVDEEAPESRDSLTTKPDRHPSDVEIRVDLDTMRERAAEKRVSEWTPMPCDSDVPISVILDKSIDIKGQWVMRSTLRSSSLTVSGTDSLGYSVSFFTTGCLGHWKLHRNGSYSEGELRLDRPVEEYMFGVFNRFFAVRINGVERLVHPCAIAKLQSQLDSTGRIKGEEHLVNFYTYCRLDQQELENKD